MQEIQPLWEAPVMQEETEDAAQKPMTAREALEAIFGDVPSESSEPAETTESTAEEVSATEPQPQPDLQSDEDVDAAFERLLMGMPKE
ncbi:MAG: hypothetical protein K2O32_05090, partial [Acetatifactor sp.]|nr:hypothetical protein [Acetatifactor sp.]